MKTIDEIDKNLKVETKINKQGIKFYDVKRPPFAIYGLTCLDEYGFRRMPDSIASQVSEGVRILAQNTSGGRVVFSTDSPYVAIKMKASVNTVFPHMPLTGIAGFDIYTDEGEGFVYHGTAFPPVDFEGGYETVFPDFHGKKNRRVLMHFPLYNNVDELYIGVDENSQIGKVTPYKDIKPIVYYGSSITQGGCASRPGNNYPAIISRRNNIDFVCLGFSGSAHGEEKMAQYIASRSMSCFVMDYDHNDGVKTLIERHYRFYEIIRQSNPTLPIVMVSAPNFDANPKEFAERRSVIYDSYLTAKSNGDNVYFIDGETLFGDENRDCATVDDAHPNDYGFVCMANKIGAVLGKIL